MVYSSSFSNGSSTELSAAVAVDIIADSQSSSYEMSMAAVVAISPQADSESAFAQVMGDATAIGENTLAAGSASTELDATGFVTTFDSEMTVAAAAQSSDGETAYASAVTTLDLIGWSPEILIGFQEQTSVTEQNGTSTVTVATSTTEIAALDIHPWAVVSAGGSGSPAGSDPGAAGGEVDDAAGSSSLADEVISLASFDGNYASLEFSAIAIGEDTYAAVEAFVVAVEDVVSQTSVMIDIGVSY